MHTDEHMGWYEFILFLRGEKKNKRPHPGTQILSQIPEGVELKQ